MGTFKELQETLDFSDVSIACGNANTAGVDVQIIRAHKIILASYSSVFKDILRKQINAADPFIYLKDVTFDNLNAIIDFMYKGEVFVSESNLDSFLIVAHELKVQGLFGKALNNIKSASAGYEEVTGLPLKDIKEVINFTDSSQISEDLTNTSSKLLFEQETLLNRNSDNILNDLEVDTIKEETENDGKDFCDTSIINGVNECTVEDLISKTNEKYVSGHRSRLISKCKVCGKKARTDYIKEHITLKHGEMLKKELEPIDEYIADIGKNVVDGTKTRKFLACTICSKDVRSDYIRRHIRNQHEDVLAAKLNET